LTHQWFGDHVTCATWKDIWLNEGFASYGEYLFLKQFRGDTTAASRMMTFHKKLLPPNDAGGSIYVDDTTNKDRIFDGRLSYCKAGAVIHTLRFVFNNDSLFFALLKKYQQQFAFGVASTNDFKLLAEQVLKKNLTVFFDQWIYKQGYPIYSAEWNNVGNEVYVKLKQSTTHPGSVAVFNTPIEIRLLSPLGDTTLRVENGFNEQVYKIVIDRKITGIVLDPDNWILNDEKGIVKNAELGLNQVISGTVYALPNPTTDYWMIVGMPLGCDMLLTDAAGMVVRKDNNGNNSGKVMYTDGLAKGMYMLYLLQGKQKVASLKLLKL
jgi:hypothetical protein